MSGFTNNEGLNMGLFGDGLSRNKFIDDIRCDESDYLIWKWRTSKETKWTDKKANRIRYGSYIRVKEGEVAVFVYRNEETDEVMQDFIVGPYDGELETINIPDISNLLGFAYGDGNSFPGEVYFINMADIIQIKFAVPYFDVYDSHDAGFSLPVAVRGTINFNITNYKNFIYLHKLENFSLSDFKDQIKDSVSRYVKSIILNAPSEYGIPLIQLERRIEEINQLVESKIVERFQVDFGVTVTSVDISAIEINKESAGYSLLNLREVSKANKELKAQKASKVSLPSDAVVVPTPPPISSIVFYLVKDGAQKGPFTLDALKAMIADGSFTKGSMVWMPGMKNWLVASEIDMLKELFLDQKPPKML